MIYRVLGPFDRYNYGDLLFPLILKYKIESLGYQVEFYGLVESDFTNYGAVKTLSISNFYSDLSKGDKVIIAGGESLCTSWADLYSYLNKLFDYIYGNRIAKGIDRRINIFSWLARSICSGQSRYPFAFSPRELKLDVSISFNAVGGAALNTWPYKKLHRFVENINDSKLIGVRDNLTYSALKKIRSEMAVELVPDSAILMQRFYSKELDELKIRKKYKLPEKYIYFQVGNEKYSDLNVIYNELKSLANETGYAVVLCAIGHALGHEDLKPLQSLHRMSQADGQNNFIIISDMLNVFDLMCLIKESSLYIGTSLHGVITSLSFGVPYVPLNKEIKKVGEYLKEWGVRSLSQQCDEDQIVELGINALKVNSSDIMRDVERQKNIASEFLDRLIE
ncbi:polysaccharide pyruvyl transferase family protein [Halomonas urumqiensis]|uniref:Polysaccharide pyruvyl transferase domain-containing protein n=1 Tax=Halomonas urumqiensis TaxID=1684789 RepID=A0A2N7UPY8_9GAMM|nr:polysaccharide pyruvyl transferase family protein [Halomonas urumqiensis]PMR82495.1 hypothetical protein C1H70_01895 [Halomonas urumqiensis]PTB04024.1 polysaccharide pyruvyl transferase family protein [Halomonas urumqiensis]GHE19715.1 hypothetical protein GCM10017767_02360 [Halomonas urumqiensis]